MFMYLFHQKHPITTVSSIPVPMTDSACPFLQWNSGPEFHNLNMLASKDFTASVNASSELLSAFLDMVTVAFMFY